MIANTDKRPASYPRNLITVSVPALSPVLLEAENVCNPPLCFTVTSPTKADPNDVYWISIRVSECIIDECKALVSWSRKIDNEPEAWQVGLLLNMPDSERERFLAAFEKNEI